MAEGALCMCKILGEGTRKRQKGQRLTEKAEVEAGMTQPPAAGGVWSLEPIGELSLMAP